MAETGPGGEEPRPDPVTERAARAYLEARIRELEGRKAALEASRDLHRERADAYRARVELLSGRIGSMSRVARAWFVARNSLRSPARLARLPLELVRIVRGGVPSLAEPGPPAEESPETLELAAAQARRATVLAAVQGRVEERAEARPLAALRVALIADDPLRDALGAECRVIALAPDRWREQLEAEAPELLLVESAERGNGGAWQHRIGWQAHPLSIGLADLRALLAGCEEQGIPTVFWDTKGRHAWERHRPAAVRFGQFFSVDADVAELAGRLPERRFAAAGVLLPAAQPRLHHPIRGLDGSAGNADPRLAYLGVFDRRLPLARREALEWLLDAAAVHGLVIHDPEAASAPGPFGFPDRFAGRLGPRPHEAEVPEILRRHPLFLLGGHDPDSAGDLPERLPALLAAGRSIVATPGRAIEAFAGALVREVADPEAARLVLEELLGSEEARRRIRLAAVPAIAEAHTIRHRLERICRSLGIALDARAASTAVLVLDDPSEAERARLVESIAGQARRPQEVVIGSLDPDGPGAELAAALAGRLRGIPVRLVAQDDRPAGERIRRLAAVASSDRVAVFGACHRYGPGHLAGLGAIADGPGLDVAGICRYTTLDGRLIDGPEDLLATAVHPDAALARRELVLERGWPDDPAAALARFGEWSASGVRIVAVAADAFVADPRLALPLRAGAAA